MSTSMQIGYPVYVNGTIDRDTVLRLNARLGLTLFWYKRFHFFYENLAGQMLVRLQRLRKKNRKCCIKTRPTWPLITLHNSKLNLWNRLSKILCINVFRAEKKRGLPFKKTAGQYGFWTALQVVRTSFLGPRPRILPPPVSLFVLESVVFNMFVMYKSLSICILVVVIR